MRTGIISDLHSNLQATEKVLEYMQTLSIDRCICLGDLVGYGGNPEEVMNLVTPVTQFTVMGNHDAAVAGQMDYNYYYEAAKQALDWTRAALSEKNLNTLNKLPYFRNEDNVCYVHGEPINPEVFNYVYTLEQAEKLVLDYDSIKNVTFVGHSHLRRIYEIRPSNAVEYSVENIKLDPNKKYVIAVGSVGQPRDFDTRSSMVVWDDETRMIEWHRVEYDIDAAVEAILKAGLPEYFAARLYSGS